MDKIKYEFSATTYQSSSSEEMCGWTFVSLPKELSAVIRENFKHLEEGWGRMKVTAKLGSSEWQTAIWLTQNKIPICSRSKRKSENKKMLHLMKMCRLLF